MTRSVSDGDPEADRLLNTDPLAVLVGIPAGLALTGGMLTALSNIYGFGQVNLSFNGWALALLVPLVVLVSLLGSTIPARWAAKLSIVRVLREE